MDLRLVCISVFAIVLISIGTFNIAGAIIQFSQEVSTNLYIIPNNLILFSKDHVRGIGCDQSSGCSMFVSSSMDYEISLLWTSWEIGTVLIFIGVVLLVLAVFVGSRNTNASDN